MQKYLIIIGNNPEMVIKVKEAMKEAGFKVNHIPSDARLLSVNTIRESTCDWEKDVNDICDFYAGLGVQLLWAWDVLYGKAFYLDGATEERVDKDHPPKGYRVVNEKDMKHPFPEDAGIMWWTKMDGMWIDSDEYPGIMWWTKMDGMWIDSDEYPWWDSRNPHCIPVDYVFKTKTVKK